MSHCADAAQGASVHCDHGYSVGHTLAGAMKSSCVGCECQAAEFVASPAFEFAKPLAVSSVFQFVEQEPQRHLAPHHTYTISAFGSSISPGLLSTTVVLRI